MKKTTSLRKITVPKKTAAMALCITLALTAAACQNSTSAADSLSSTSAADSLSSTPTANCPDSPTTAASPTPEEQLGMPNPFIECSTREEAVEKAGFDFSVPDQAGTYDSRSFMVIEGELIQAIYRNSNEPDYSALNDEEISRIDWSTVDFSSHDLLIRKAVGDGDITGDYNHYPENDTIFIDGLQVHTRGENGNINTAAWTENGCSFALVASDAISREEASELIRNVK